MPKNPQDRLIDFIVERHHIYKRRKAGDPKPWTDDKILQRYRFCNVYRELDAVTDWIADNWRTPFSEHEDLWFAMLVARYINAPITLHAIGFPIPWKPQRFINIVESRQAKGLNVFNAAYIIPPTAGSAIGGTTVGGPKHKALARFFQHFWDNRQSMRPVQNQSLSEYADKLCTVPGMGRFFAGQIIADLKYAVGNALWKSPDWWQFAISGPGSRRGLNRVLNYPVQQSWKEDEWFEELDTLRRSVNKRIVALDMPKLHGQDMQNCLCEFDKYERARLGEGRPKQKFNGV